MNTSGYYLLSLNGDFQPEAYLFEHYFNPYNSKETHLAIYGGFCKESQLGVVVYFQSSITYVLFVTTLFIRRDEEGSFTVIVKGPDRILLKQTGKCDKEKKLLREISFELFRARY